jgi:hypothetical protein
MAMLAKLSTPLFILASLFSLPLLAADAIPPFPADPDQNLERTCFQTGKAWGGPGNLRSDVAIVYGIDPGLPDRIKTWRDRGYRIHVMTGVAWGNYQDYLYGRFDGVNHEDAAQSERNGNKIGHGGDVYYMCPEINYGKFLCVGVQRALDAGAEAIHLEEPEFWVRGGYSAAFKREWKSYYNEDWQPPHTSIDAQWRASKLKYFLYRRTLQQVFGYVQDFNRRTGRHVRCYVPTHSLLNYAHWHIVSPESSLARLNGCDGYIAQVWTGTSRTPNMYRGVLRERTFETAFLEYGVMQNLVRGTGRRVWYLNDPIEDNPGHDWNYYRTNWESTLIASLFQPDVWQYEVAPWPERIFAGRYPRRQGGRRRGFGQGQGQRQGQPIPPAYATELQVVMNALNDLHQSRVQWNCGTSGLGVLVSDGLMFQRGDPTPSDEHMSHIYGMAMPLLKRGMPVTPVQLENVTLPGYLDPFHVLFLTYQGMKPLSAEVHAPLVEWVKRGGALVIFDDDSDPYNSVREWWNSGENHYRSPRNHLFQQFGLADKEFAADAKPVKLGKGTVTWLRENPAKLADAADGDERVAQVAKHAAESAGRAWQETSSLLLRRGPYLIGAGLDESMSGEPKALKGRYVNLFDAELRVRPSITLSPGSRYFLVDLDALQNSNRRVLASACKALPSKGDRDSLTLTVEGVPGTPAVVLLHTDKDAVSITLAGQAVADHTYSAADQLLWVRFENSASPRELVIKL